jgi:hypothetical protein
VAPVEFRGEWSRPPAPFLHPIYTRNWLNVRIETVSADSQAVQGRFDMYVRSMCEDLVDEPFTGTFDGQVLRFTYEYQHCPGMKPLVVRLWKDDAGFAGRANRLPFRIQRIIEAAAH